MQIKDKQISAISLNENAQKKEEKGLSDKARKRRKRSIRQGHVNIHCMYALESSFINSLKISGL